MFSGSLRSCFVAVADENAVRLQGDLRELVGEINAAAPTRSGAFPVKHSGSASRYAPEHAAPEVALWHSRRFLAVIGQELPNHGFHHQRR